MTKSSPVLAGAFALLALCAADAGAQTKRHSAVEDFKITSNPNGSWSYLAANSLLGYSTKNGNGIKGWNGWTNDQPLPDSALLYVNRSGATIHWTTIVQPTYLLRMDPQSNANITVRFTAKFAGEYAIRGGFKGIDTREQSHQVEVRHNGIALKKATIAAYGDTFTFEQKLKLAAGDTLDFASDTGEGYYDLSTGFNAVILGPLASGATTSRASPIAGGLDAR